MSQTEPVPSVEQARNELTIRSPSRQSVIEKHADLVLSMPEPGQSWLWQGLEVRESVPDEVTPANIEHHRARLKVHSIIEPIHEIYFTHPQGENSWIKVWKTNPEAYRLARAVREARKRQGNAFPCGHSSGFTTIDADRGVYECGFEYCSRRFDRKTVEGVIR